MTAPALWRWSVMAGVFVVSLTAMVAAQRWYQSHRTAPALIRVEGLPGVEWARVEPGPAGRTLWVGLGPVDDPAWVVGQLRRMAMAGELGPLQEIVLVDRRSPKLASLAARFQLALQEAAWSGAFLRIQQHVAEQAADQGVQARLFADSHAVYLLLVEGDHHLYEVVPRPGSPSAWPGSAVVPVRAQGPLDQAQGQGPPARGRASAMGGRR